MLCMITFNMSAGTHILKSTPNDGFFSNFFMAGFFTLRVIARNLMPDMVYEPGLYV